MNLIGRQDRILLIGLAVALFAVFLGRSLAEQPIRYILAFARDVERYSGLALIPALTILIVAFFFHQQAKRQESIAQTAAAEVDVQRAQSHAAELERLVTFGQTLGRSLDIESIRDVILQHLPRLMGTDDVWVMLRVDGHWQTLMGSSGSARDGREASSDLERAREQTADRTLSDSGAIILNPMSAGGQVCIPLTAGGFSVGVLGVPESAGPFSDSRGRIFAAAAALLGISIRNAQLFREVRENSLRDGLTGCFNRTHAMEAIDTELRRARRTHLPVSLIMFDIDRFKEVNDRYGHLCGDAVLAAVGARMKDLLRGSDLKCRYGGEEFLALLPETPLEGAKRVADGLRKELSEISLQWKDDTIRITASFGVTVSLPSEIDVEALVGRADQALYRAKDQGRNCVRLSIETAVA
jgi:diguanylate cyclase (GGDEF)-like protein